MADRHLYHRIILVFSLATATFGHGDIRAILNQVTLLEKEVNDMKFEEPRFEARIINKMGMAELTLRADLVEKIIPDYIQDKVEEAFSRVLQDHLIDQMVKDMVRSEIQYLKQNYHELEEHLHVMTRRLKNSEEEVRKQVEFSTKLENEIRKCETKAGHIQTELERLEGNLTRVEAILESSSKAVSTSDNDTASNVESVTTLLRTISSKAVSTSTSQQPETRYTTPTTTTNTTTTDVWSTTSTSIASSSASTSQAAVTYTTTTLPPTTTQRVLPPTTSSTMPVGMQRLLLVPRWSDSSQHPYQLNIYTRKVSPYTYISASSVRSVTYDPVLRRIIFSRAAQAAGIYASVLDETGVETLKSNVISHGMAVDVERKLIIFTTNQPQYTVSQMTTRGNDFRRVVDLTDYRTQKLRGIALDTIRRVIYICNGDRILSADYDGKNVRTFARKWERFTDGVNAVAYDPASDCLFFNLGKRVIKRSLSSGENTELIRLDHIWKFVFYNDSLFISTYRGGNIHVIQLENNVHIKLKKMTHSNNDIVLLP